MLHTTFGAVLIFGIVITLHYSSVSLKREEDVPLAKLVHFVTGALFLALGIPVAGGVLGVTEWVAHTLSGVCFLLSALQFVFIKYPPLPPSDIDLHTGRGRVQKSHQ